MYILLEHMVAKLITCMWSATFTRWQNAAAVSLWGHRRYIESKSKEKQSWISKAEFLKNQYFIMEGAMVMDGSKWKYSSGDGSSMWGSHFVPAEWKIDDWCVQGLAPPPLTCSAFRRWRSLYYSSAHSLYWCQWMLMKAQSIFGTKMFNNSRWIWCVLSDR